MFSHSLCEDCFFSEKRYNDTLHLALTMYYEQLVNLSQQSIVSTSSESPLPDLEPSPMQSSSLCRCICMHGMNIETLFRLRFFTLIIFNCY